MGSGLVIALLVASACQPAQGRGGFDPKSKGAPTSSPGTAGGGAPVSPPPVPGMIHPPPVVPTGAGDFVGRTGTGLVLHGQPWQFTGYDVYNAASRANCGETCAADGCALRRSQAVGGTD